MKKVDDILLLDRNDLIKNSFDKNIQDIDQYDMKFYIDQIFIKSELIIFVDNLNKYKTKILKSRYY